MLKSLLLLLVACSDVTPQPTVPSASQLDIDRMVNAARFDALKSDPGWQAAFKAK